MGPHFYNTDDEILGALDAISEILHDGSWRRFEGRNRDPVT
jgi:hypothetical protein